MAPVTSASRSRGGPLAAAALGFLAFLYFFDPRILDPRRIDWVSGGDIGTNFLGFHFFRHEPWTWPPGLLVNYAHGTQASIGLTDSVPLLAFVLKPFDALLPDAINYLGLWIAACYVLQGYFGFRVLEALGVSRLRALGGALLLCLMPFMAARATLHVPLASHWLLLAAIYLYLASLSDARRYAGWCALLPVAVVVNPYLFSTISPIFAASFAVLAWKGDGETRLRTFKLSLAAGFLAIAALYLVGFFTVSVANTWGAYGQLQVNLLAWFNSQGVGVFLPTLPVSELGQTDAYMYLGVGGIAVLLLGVLRLAWERPWLRDGRYVPLILAALAILALAMSHRIAAGPIFLAEIPIPPWLQEKLNPFRSSGRMAWLPTYLMMAAAIAACARMGPRLFAVVIVGAIALNLADNRNIRITGQTMVDRSIHRGYPSCEALPASVEKVVFIPRIALEDSSLADAWPIAVCAAQQNQPINVGYLARMDLKRVDAAQREAAAWLARDPSSFVAYAYRNPAVATALGAPADTPSMGSFRVYVSGTGSAKAAPAPADPAWQWPLLVDMGVLGHGRHAQLVGWAPPVMNWVWSYGRELSLLLPVPRDLAGEARLHFFAQPRPPGETDLPVAVKANGRDLGSLTLRKDGGLAWYSIAVPAEVIESARGVVRVELLLPEMPAFRPARTYPDDRVRLWLARVGFSSWGGPVTKARFGAHTPDVSMLVEHWSWPEPWGTWSDGPAPKVRVPVPRDAAGGLRLRVFGHAYAREGRQKVAVVVAGRTVAEWEYPSLGPDEWREAEIPAGLVEPAAREIEIVFVVAAPSPPAIPGSTDTRKLGFALVELELSPR